MTKEVLLMIKQTVKNTKENEMDENTLKAYIDIWKEVLSKYIKNSSLNFYLIHPTKHFDKYFNNKNDSESNQSFHTLINTLFEDGFEMLTENGTIFPDYFYITKQKILNFAKQDVNNYPVKRK